MKHIVKSLLTGMLAACFCVSSVCASSVSADKSSFTLASGENSCRFSVVLHADEAFAGAEFGLKPSGSDVTLAVAFQDVKSESTVKTVKNGVTYFGFFAGSNKFAAGDYRIAEITCTYSGSDSRKVSLDSSKIVMIDESGSTRSDETMRAFSVTITRENSNTGGGGASGGGGGGASGGGGGAITPAPKPVTETEAAMPVEDKPTPGVSGTFSDVKESDFFYDPVGWALEKGITRGVDNGHFGPLSVCKRAEVLTFLWRYSGSPKATGANPFTDLRKEDYYYDAALWALSMGISNGNGDNTMAGVADCNRGQVVTMLWRAAGCPEPQDTTNIFTDMSPEDYYYKAVLWAVEEGITKGNGDNTFAGIAVCDRGQIVTFLYRFSKLKA